MSGKVVTNKEYKPLSEYRKDILNQKFEKRNLDVVKGRFKNKNFTKSLNSLGNDITRAERDFNAVINEIYNNTSIINDQNKLTELEERVNQIAEKLPDDEELREPFYQNFWNAVNSAYEYNEAKGNNNFYQLAETTGALNNFVDLSNEFDKVPTFEEVENHLYEILDSGISFDTKTKGYKIDIKQTKVKRGENKPTNVVNKLTKKGNKNLNQSKIKRNNKYLKAIEKLINNSQKTENVNENMKSSEKPHVKNYHNFDVNVRIAENIYQVRLQTEEWFEDKEQDSIKTVHLYNIKEINKTSAISPETDGTKPIRKGSENNISQNNNNVKFYQLTGMPKNQPIRSGAYNVSEKVIELFKDANYSTLPHEMAHFWLDNIWTYAKSGKASETFLRKKKKLSF